MKKDSVDAFVPIPFRWCNSGYLLTNRLVDKQDKVGQLVRDFGEQLDEISRLATQFKNLSTSAKKRKLDSYPVHLTLNRYIDLVNRLNEKAFRIRSELDDQLYRQLRYQVRKRIKMAKR